MIPEDMQERAPRTHRKVPVWPTASFVTYVAVFMAGAGIAVYVLYWLEEWVAAILSGLATMCLFLPWFARREYKAEIALTEETNDRLEAHSIATDHFLQIKVDRMQEWLSEEQKKDRLLIEGLVAERDALAEDLRRRTPLQDPITGRFISSGQPKLPRKRAARAATLPAPTIEPPPVIEGTLE